MFKFVHVDMKPTIKAWKLLNFKISAFLKIVKLLVVTIISGYKKAVFTKNPSVKFCSLCTTVLASLTHLLSTSPIMKKM